MVYRPVKARLDKLIQEKSESFNKIENFNPHKMPDNISSSSADSASLLEVKPTKMFDVYKNKKNDEKTNVLKS